MSGEAAEAAEAAAREMGAPAMRKAQAELAEERAKLGGLQVAQSQARQKAIEEGGDYEEGYDIEDQEAIIKEAETKVRQVGADKDTQMQNLLRASMGMEPVRKMRDPITGEDYLHWQNLPSMAEMRNTAQVSLESFQTFNVINLVVPNLPFQPMLGTNTDERILAISPGSVLQPNAGSGRYRRGH